MPRNAKTVTVAASARKAGVTQKLRTILALLQAARLHAGDLSVGDDMARADLADSVQLAELSVLRLLADEEG